MTDIVPAQREQVAARFFFTLIVGIVLLVALLVVHLSQGGAEIPFSTVLHALFAYEGGLNEDIVRHLRMPRAVAGIFTGALLAVAGVLFQSATRNPLASPATLGVNSGAFLAVVATAALFPALKSGIPSVFMAFMGGLAAAALVVVVAGGLTAAPIRLALAGMAIAMALGAGAAVLQILYEQRTAGLFFWGSGALIQDGWGTIQTFAPFMLVTVLGALAMGRPLELLALGDDTARSLGQRVEQVRVGAILVAVFLSALAVALTGPIGFVGLVAPHLVRLMGVRRQAPIMIVAMVWGAVLVVGADVLGRLLSGGTNEIPAGIITAVIGTPFLIWLAQRVPREPARATSEHATAGPSTRRRLPLGVALVTVSVALFGMVAVGIRYGEVPFRLLDVVAVLLGGGTSLDRFILIDLRLPRVAMAALAGACLAGSGLLLQGVVRNPLAAPELVGVMAGAGVGAVGFLFLFPGVPLVLLPVAAFLGAVLAFTVVYGAAWRDGVSPERLALVGIGVAALGTALIHLLVIRSDMRIAQALVWLAGSTYAQGWGDLVPLSLWALLLVPVAWIVCRELDILALGDDSATGLGLTVERSRLVHLLLAVALAAAAVATVGTVGFVGLVAPHAARLLVGGRHRGLLPLSLLLGALLLVTADVLGRSVLAPRQIPFGLVAAVLGAPYFVWLLRRSASGS